MSVRLGIYPQPEVRGDCRDMPRPCRFVSCKWHMVGLWKVEEADHVVDKIFSGCDTCVLDVADRGEHTEQQVADAAGITLQQVRWMTQSVRKRPQPEGEALAFYAAKASLDRSREQFDHYAPGKIFDEKYLRKMKAATDGAKAT